MKQFDLYEPTTLSEATGLLNQFGAKAKVVAGGSDLLAANPRLQNFDVLANFELHQVFADLQRAVIG